MGKAIQSFFIEVRHAHMPKMFIKIRG